MNAVCLSGAKCIMDGDVKKAMWLVLIAVSKILGVTTISLSMLPWKSTLSML